MLYYHNYCTASSLSSSSGVVVRSIPTYPLLLDSLYPPPACPVCVCVCACVCECVCVGVFVCLCACACARACAYACVCVCAF